MSEATVRTETPEENQNTLSLWNPNAAVNWSLLFTPIFGAWIHAINWKRLGNLRESTRSMLWVYASIAFVVLLTGYVLVSSGSVANGFYILPTIAWYLVNGVKQPTYVKNNGIKYTKESWTIPILAGFMALGCYYILVFILAFSATLISETRMRNESTKSEVGATALIDQTLIEQTAVSIMDDILKQAQVEGVNCIRVQFLHKLPTGESKATAILNNGENLPILVSLNGDIVQVQVERVVPGVAIEEVLTQFGTVTNSVKNLDEMIPKLRSIDTQACPPDFRETFVAMIQAWEKLGEIESKSVAFKKNANSGEAFVESVFRGFLGDPFGKAIEIAETGTIIENEWRDAQKELVEALRQIERLAARYGAQINGAN